MSILEHAHRLVSTYLVGPDDSVVDAERTLDAILVNSLQRTWRVEPAPVSLPGWAIYDVTLEVMSDPGQQPEGFAVSATDKVFHLTEKPEFEKFWRLAGHELAPGDVATVLTRYQSPAPPTHVVGNREELDRIVGVRTAREIKGLTSLCPVQDDSGNLRELTFSTWHVAGDEDTITVDRWRVLVDRSGQLTWAVTTLAKGLPWLIAT